MKLKLVVASMSVLGLISCPVLADQTTHKHRHHKTMSHANVQNDYKDVGYKDMGVRPVEVCPKVDMYDSMLDQMSHNLGRAKPTVHCSDPLSLAGGINFDSTWGNRHIGYSGENTARLSLNDAYVNVYGNVNDWTQAFLSLSYANFQPYRGLDAGGGTGPANGYLLNGIYSNSYAQNQAQLEQGFITFKNMDWSPLFVRVGRMFQDFGRYDIHPITESLPQVLEESLRTSAQFGFMTRMGFNGSVYTFENGMRQLNPGGSYSAHNRNNWGSALNFSQPSDQLGYDVGIGYLADFTGVDQVQYAVAGFNGTTPNLSGYNGTYRNRVSAFNLHGNLNSGPFTLGVHYVTALQNFSTFDLPTRTAAAIAAGGTSTGAKPWAFDIIAGYGFSAWGKDQNVYLGYQASQNAVNIFLPKARWLAGYGINILKSTNLGLQWNHDQAYSASYGGVGGTSNLVALRAAVIFG